MYNQGMRSMDVVIVGGGPAGLATALHLVRLDPAWADRCLVLEREHYPRHKLCGGGVTPFGLSQLRRLGLRLKVPYVPVRELHFCYRGRIIRLPGDPALVVVRREAFDAWLAQETRARGVRVVEGQRVQSLEPSPDGLVVHTERETFLARAVVGADGSRGVVRRALGTAGRSSRVARLLEVLTPASGAEPEFLEGVARFEFSPVREHLQGYAWDFPSLVAGRPTLNQGVYDARVAVRRPKANLPRLLAAHLGHAPEKVEGHPIHRFTPWNRLAGPGLLLVGDAAGADPLFGEGIGPALAYGEVAARTLHTAFQRGDLSFQTYRRQLLASPVGRYLLLRWYVAWWCYRLSGSDLVMRALWRVGRVLARTLGPPPAVPEALPEPRTASGAQKSRA